MTITKLEPYKEKKVENTNIKIEEMGIEITKKAMDQYNAVIIGQEEPKFHIRIGVKGGGCQGYQFIHEFIEEKDVDSEEDLVKEIDGKFFVMDIFSKEYLKGTTIDFTNSLSETGFKFISSSPSSRSCGCGKSFSV